MNSKKYNYIKIVVLLVLIPLVISYVYLTLNTQTISSFISEKKKIFSGYQAISGKAQDVQYNIANINYNESTEIISNPERGFYSTNSLKMLREGGTATIFYKNSFVQLKVDISDFSGAQNGDKDYEFTESALELLDKTLENAKNSNSSVILRFVYDKNCDGIQSDEGVADYDDAGNYLGRHVEPSIEMVEHHMAQLKDIFYKYSTTIYNIQVGLFGSYGELHSSTMCTDENISRAVKAILDNSPDDITVSVRTPGRFANFAGIDVNNIDTFISQEGTDSYRVGMFNDGYLGSESDLGSFSNREKAYTWLNTQATHVPYGGETLPNYDSNAKVDGYTYMNKYSIMPYCEKEMYLAHTSYLNYEWDQRLHKEWQDTVYDGENELYKNSKKSDGTSFSDYDFINIHLGYRLVIKNSLLPEEVEENSNFTSELTVENVGFAPVIKNKKTRLIFVNEEDETQNYKVDIDLNVKEFASNETITKEINSEMPIDLKQGNYKVYLQVYSEELEAGGAVYLPIRFANEDVWNDTLNANYIGNIKVVEKKEIETSSDTNNNINNNTITNTNIDTNTNTSTNTNNSSDINDNTITNSNVNNNSNILNTNTNSNTSINTNITNTSTSTNITNTNTNINININTNITNINNINKNNTNNTNEVLPNKLPNTGNINILKIIISLIAVILVICIYIKIKE